MKFGFTQTVASLLVAGFFLVTAFPAAATHGIPCGTTTVVTLYGGKTINTGTVTVYNDDAHLFVVFSTTGGWQLVETHLAIAASLADIPQTKSGNPKVGNFPYNTIHNPPVTEYTYVIALDTLPDSFVVAAHAVVQLVDSSGQVTQQETGWGNGSPFPGKNWAMYFSYTKQKCNELVPCQLRTQTQGGWGTVCKGNNPGCYRDNNFAAAFPSGLLIGDSSAGGRFAHFSSSLAIVDFLPQGSTPGALELNYYDPGSTTAGVLGGNVTALTLSVTFDQYDPSFGASSSNLASAIITSGPEDSEQCIGMSVQQVLHEANQVLAGHPSTFTPSDINACVDLINNNYVNGTGSEGYLSCPAN